MNICSLVIGVFIGSLITTIVMWFYVVRSCYLRGKFNGEQEFLKWYYENASMIKRRLDFGDVENEKVEVIQIED